MGQTAAGCGGDAASQDEIFCCRERRGCCDDAAVSSGGPWGPKQGGGLMSGTGGTGEDTPTDDADASRAGLSGMMSASTSAGPGTDGEADAPFSVRTPPCGEYQLSLANVLDIFSICSRSLPVLRASLDALRRPPGAPLDVARLRAVAAAAGAQTPEALAAALPHVTANLRAVDASGALDADLAQRLDAVIAASADWAFDASGRVDSAPRLTDPDLLKMCFSQETLAVVRRMACAHIPPEKHDFEHLSQLRREQFSSSVSARRPHVVVTVGPPGAGKTFVLRNMALKLLREKYDAPPIDDFVFLDPDYYISNVLDNNNEHREMANFLNHESFMCAAGQQRHVLFDHTGKDLLNTCGRVISRFKEANYVVHLVIVLSDYAMCRSRTTDRLESTGRSVAEEYTRMVFAALQKTIPWYLENHGSIADNTLLYTNTSTQKPPTAKIIETEEDVRDAIALAQARLQLKVRSSKMAPSKVASSS